MDIRKDCKNTKKSTGNGAYITVLFSMILLTVISVVLTSVESVRISAVRMRAEISCAIACEAFLSQFQPQVQARYGLFLLERDGYDDLFLKQFIERNCGGSDEASGNGVQWTSAKLVSAAIIDERFVSDENFQYFEKQICDYMKIAKGSDYAKSIIKRLTGFTTQSLDQKKDSLTDNLSGTGSISDVKKAEAEAKAAEENNGDASQGSGTGTDKNNSQVDSGKTEVVDPRKNLTQLLRYPILTLMMDGRLSSAVLDTGSLSDIVPAERNVSQIKGFLQYQDVTGSLQNSDLGIVSRIASLGETLLADSYIIDYLKNASTPEKKSGVCFPSDTSSNNGESNMTDSAGRNDINGNSALQYEVEYIISGNAKDVRNLENTVNRIALIRMLLNLTYLYTDHAKTSAARTVATALAAVILMPFLEEIFYLLILAAWAYAEALVDCKNLLSGGKVPLMKNESTWNLSLNQLSQLQSSQLEGYANQSSDDEGQSYEDYLYLLLLSVPKEKKYIRLLNIIEANTHLETGGESFSAGKSVLGITFNADFEFNAVFAANPLSGGRYEHHVLKSGAY